MVIIHSSSNDLTTISVLAWLFHFGKTTTRVNDELPFPEVGVGITNHIYKDNNTVQSNYWFRRGAIIMVREKINYFDCHNFINYLDNDLAKYAQFYNSQLANFDFINLPQDNEINKLFVYTVARNLQILFPETWVGSKIENCPFLTNKARFIAKSLNSPNLIVKFRGITFQLHSSNVLIQKNDIDNETIPKKFMPSLFQEYIEKKYELRIFYLKGAFYRRGSCPHEPSYLYHLHESSFRHSDCRSGDRQLAAGNA